MADHNGIMKCSMILISSGETEAVYRSVQDVPLPLRRKLLKSTSGLNSATILIADRRGREEIARAMRNLASAKPSARAISREIKAAIASLLAAGSAALIWFMFAHKWL
jgi:hypothetical protein